MNKKPLLKVCCVLFILTLVTYSWPSKVSAAGSVKSLKRFAGEWVKAKQSLNEETYLKLYCDGLKPRIVQYLYNNLDYWRQVRGQWKLVRVNRSTIDDTGLGELNFTYQGSRLEGYGRVRWEVTRTFFLRAIDGCWKIIGWGHRSERMLD